MQITNLVAIVSIVLSINTTTRWPTHDEPAPRPAGVSPFTLEYRIKDPDHKWVRKTVTETKQLQFTNDLPPIVLTNQIISDIEVAWHLTKWETNFPAPIKFGGEPVHGVLS